jgi:hypothetical protein
VDKDDEDHEDFGKRIGRAELSLAKIFAVASFAAFLASILTRLVK